MSLAISVFMHVFWFGLGLLVALIALSITGGIIMGTIKFFLDFLDSKL